MEDKQLSASGSVTSNTPEHWWDGWCEAPVLNSIQFRILYIKNTKLDFSNLGFPTYLNGYHKNFTDIFSSHFGVVPFK